MIDSTEQLGYLVKLHREARSLTQEDLAARCGRRVNRSAIAHLEQGRRLPSPEGLQAVAEELGIPDAIWRPFARAATSQRHKFETALAELVGHPVALRVTDEEAVASAETRIAQLFRGHHTLQQEQDLVNSILVFYAVPRMSTRFFLRYFSKGAFESVDTFLNAVRHFQKDAIRLFSTFGEAYRQMNDTDDLEALLEPLAPRSISNYFNRTPWYDTETGGAITEIPEDRLIYLGYISVSRYEAQLQKRKTLAGYLIDLAARIREHGPAAVAELSAKRRRKIDSLLQELDSQIQHAPISPLFAPDPDELEREARRILREDQDLHIMRETQSVALRNLSNFVTADHMDVYVATSMRTESDYVSVNRFVRTLFGHHLISPLRLRFFNPTQSWIEDRVSKGLVEALMLRRADFTIYMAQQHDTFGKDSEASVALGQGKPVIVYVPKLSFPDRNLDSEFLFGLPESKLRNLLAAEQNPPDPELEQDETLNHQALFDELLTQRLLRLDDRALASLVRRHWADFGLLDETVHARHPGRAGGVASITGYLRRVIAGEEPPITPDVRVALVSALVATTLTFEKRAKTFREVHPLALQVILSSGVLNGILVARSVESCAHLLRALIENDLELELEVDAYNYRLKEVTTGSTIRVISRNNLLTNAFDAFYRRSRDRRHGH